MEVHEFQLHKNYYKSSAFVYRNSKYLNSVECWEIRLPLQLGCLTPRKLLYKPSKSKNISTSTSICTHGGSWVQVPPITNLKVVHSCTISISIFIVWNVKKLVRGNLISLFSVHLLIVYLRGWNWLTSIIWGKDWVLGWQWTIHIGLVDDEYCEIALHPINIHQGNL